MQSQHDVRTKLERQDPVSAVEQWDLVIRPVKGWVPLQPGEWWAYRELLYFLVWRNLKVRYKQTALGAAWAVIQPFMGMVVFSIFFGRLAAVPSDGLPYPLFSYAGLIPWTYFADALTRASTSLVDNERMLTKIYFPRLFIPLSVTLSGLVDLGIALILLIGMMGWYGLTPTGAVWTLPLFIFMAGLTSFSVSLWLSALNVQYRDVRYALSFLVQVWLFATPVAYPSSLVPERWRALYGLNPMAGVVEGFRWALLGNTPLSPSLVAVSLAAVIILCLGGLYYFRRMEETFADVV
jgi:lipopolysaccharide transport system permease protein